MKSSDFIIETDAQAISREIDADMRDPKQRQQKLKQEIEAGLIPTVHNVSSTTDPVYTMGDVEALGWMTKDYHTERTGHDDYDTTWTRYYHHEAPGPIKVKAGGNMPPELWKPGHQEED